jgi:hypothetical protein
MNTSSWNNLFSLIQRIDSMGDLNRLTRKLIQLEKASGFLDYKQQEKVRIFSLQFCGRVLLLYQNQ